MKYYVTQMAVLLAVVYMFTACGGAPKFSSVRDKNWMLVEMRNKSETILFDRNKLKEEGFENIFTLRFDADRVSGVGAPNQYGAPYTSTDKQAITIKPAIQTLMAPLREPEKLKENEFFNYLHKATKWNLANGNFELYSQGDDGEVVLVFAPGKGK
jgi:heat shock protein HslJ